MKYCKYCGAQMNDGDAVCPSCGRAAETQPTHSAGNHLLDSALLGCAYDSCIQQFDKRHETARRVGFQNLCVAVCQPDYGYIDALRQ